MYVKDLDPKTPKGPSGQPTGQDQTQVIKEELEEPQVVTEGKTFKRQNIIVEDKNP